MLSDMLEGRDKISDVLRKIMKGRDSELKISSTPMPTPENELDPVLRAEAMSAHLNPSENGSLIKTLH
jgi:hypothetical protein